MNEIETNLQTDSVSKMALANSDHLTSSMPTPMLYISRSSSLTSLNSFDIKSVHSSIASEYSQVTSPSTAFQLKKKSDNDDDQQLYSVDDDLDLIMPESPSAQHESSFLMTQRVKHKQQQIIYRQTAAAQMMPSTESSTNMLPNNLFVNDQKATSYIQQMNKFISSSCNKTVQIDSNSESVTTQTSKPWKQCLPQPNQSLNNEQNSKLNDINQIMSRLNIKTANNDVSFRNSVTTTSTSFKSNIHTPPVKLVQQPKFISNFQQQSSQFNPVNTSLPTNTAAMSVTYAFMKNSNSSAPNVIQPVAQHPLFTNTNQFSATYQPKFLQSNQSYPAFNSTAQPIAPVLSTSSTSSSCSSSSQQSVINQLSPTSSTNHEPEAPCIYALETRINSAHKQRQNIYIQQQQIDSANNDNNRSCPLSPQESVCSRMSDSSVPSLIRQDITSRTSQFQTYVTNQQQPISDFRALFSRLNSSDSKSQVKQQSALDFNNQTLEDDEQPKCFNDEETTNVPICSSNYNFNKTKPMNQFQPQMPRQFNTAQCVSPSFNKFNTTIVPQQQYYQQQPDLDNTYSPKVFQNEGTNSRYSSASSLNQDAEQSDNEEVIVKPLAKQMNTPVVAQQLLQDDEDDEYEQNETYNDQEDDLLENFIKEMLPPVVNESKKMINSESSLSITSSITSSVSKQNIKKATVKSQLSKSNSFKENKQICPSSNKIMSSVKKAPNKRLSAESTTSLVGTKPKTLISKNIINNTTVSQPVHKPILIKSENHIKPASTPAPVVNMTKTAQLRAFNNKKLNMNLNTTKTTSTVKPQISLTSKIKPKENLTKQSSLEVNDLNSSTNLGSLEQVANTRRQSFSFGCNKINLTAQQKLTASKTDSISSRVTHLNRFNTKLNK